MQKQSDMKTQESKEKKHVRKMSWGFRYKELASKMQNTGRRNEVEVWMKEWVHKVEIQASFKFYSLSKE